VAGDDYRRRVLDFFETNLAPPVPLEGSNGNGMEQPPTALAQAEARKDSPAGVRAPTRSLQSAKR
jgi:hypothetical protein